MMLLLEDRCVSELISCVSLMSSDFEKKGKKEVSPVLDQFLCHVAKTGETM